MDQNRVNTMKKLLAEDPNDVFLRYALAIELAGHQDEEAKAIFTALLKDHPDYLPTYYHAAHLYARLGDIDLADRTYQKGIELTRADVKAHREIKNAYQNFLFENDL